jgi:hypothetical protein
MNRNLYIRFALALILATAAVAFINSQVWSRGLSSHPTAASAANMDETIKDADSAKSDKKRLNGELLTLTSDGFNPHAFERPKGRVLLLINDRSGSREVTLRLDGEDGQRLHEIHLPPGKRTWKQVVNLHPGRYTLSEADHPEWTCQITISDR